MEAELAVWPRRMDDAARARMAERADTPPEMLFFLSNDPMIAVRAAIAANAATPPLADHLLARDAEPGVRRVLARKLATLAPMLDPDTTDRHRRATWEALLLLSDDDAVAVRAAVTELVAELAHIPRPLILRLARDVAMAVAEPVLRGSPVLEEEDLLRLIADPPVPETLGAIARRPYLAEAPSDAIAQREEQASVTALLANATARIREGTLLALTARCGTQPSWQSALVRRPGLSAAVARGLQEVVAGEALRILLSRPDLPAAPVGAVGRPASVNAALVGEPPPGPVNEESFVAAARQSRLPECARILAALSGLPGGVVTRALEGRDARLLVSLCWKAGLSGRAATFAQMRLAGSQPEDLLILPGGAWALPTEAMQGLVAGLLQPS
ncbi:DUF2336 domain-containing protein [Pararoseomonas indoligenes]|uniref:DUF2336 domain-containing protein n=1 Tax=Roseomonas indoligenes TaxID=2820811 RepID=A0A940S770_9PROT|nr:DUF2336 domain-containing protein [Pararoseomonas indoligenes]MBP0494759.1 DUF2336 domain-containing protein [Pararoseomonas indoligenes]